MAGRPKTKAMVKELERRTRELFPEDENATHLDYAEHYVANGGTLVSLALSVASATGTHVMRESLRRYIHKMDGAEGRLGQARIHSSHAMVEESMAILDDDDIKRDDVPRAKMRVDGKLKVAQMFNRAEFGENKSTQINVSLGSLHLAALRAREMPQITARVIEDDEVLMIEEETTREQGDGRA